VILYTAAHGGFSREAAPLGGGAAICDRLVEEWTRTRPFNFRLITPSILGPSAPAGKQIVHFKETDYAQFSRAFERAATDEILRHDPASTVVLSNDVSEGPDFERLSQRGFRVFTIYHVDVVAYVAAIYGRGWIAPETTVRWYPRLRRLLPEMAKLVWEKQALSVRYSQGLIVPSAGMRDVLERCYPSHPPIHVLPWGVWDNGPAVSPDPLRAEFGVAHDAKRSSARGANDQARRTQHRFRLKVSDCDLTHEELRGSGAQAAGVYGDTRQSRKRVLGLFDVVEADDGDVAPDRDASLSQRADEADCDDVVETKGGGRRRVEVEQLRDRRPAARVVVHCFNDQRFIGGNSGIFEGKSIAGEAFLANEQ
jgi:hypothetical protein